MSDSKSTEELREGVMVELRDVARKAQVDYVAVNHPNGIRSGESPEFLGEFLKVNHERIMQLITTHTAKQKEKWEKEARMNELDARIDELGAVGYFSGVGLVHYNGDGSTVRKLELLVEDLEAERLKLKDMA